MNPILVGKLEEGNYLVDLRGWMCPYPKYMLEPLLKKLPTTTRRLVLMVDCPSAVDDVPKVAQTLGHETSEVKQVHDGEWQITVEIASHR